MRAWSLAKTLTKRGYQADFIYSSNYEFEPKSGVVDGVNILDWNSTNIRKLLSSYTHVILRYCTGESELFRRNINDKHIVIADCYVPIHTEVSARGAKDINKEMYHYEQDHRNWSKLLRRADYYLYASENQLHYYVGILSQLKVINPASYDDISNRMIQVPYGFMLEDLKLKTQRKNDDNYKTLLWYGAIYPWFDVRPLARAIKVISKKHKDFRFIIAGAKNPYNKNPDFIKHYEESMKILKSTGVGIEVLPWTDYSERFDIYAKADTIITINKIGIENTFAWRTRLVDYLVAQKPILTNGEDPLGESLIDSSIAYKFDEKDPKSILEAFERSLQSNISNEIYKNTLQEYAIDNNVDGLSNILNDSHKRKIYRIKHSYDLKNRRLKSKVKSLVPGPIKNFLKLISRPFL